VSLVAIVTEKEVEMRRRYWPALCAFLVFAGLTAWAAQKKMSVQVKKASLRAEASFLSAPRFEVHYGDRILVSQEQGDWMEGQVEGKEQASGWIHRSALTKKRIVLKSESMPEDVEASELALAGKGFNPDVEKAFRDSVPDANFQAVDAMERIDVPVDSLLNFLKEGGLLGGEGGER
jgi:hypothetical protein